MKAINIAALVGYKVCRSNKMKQLSNFHLQDTFVMRKVEKLIGSINVDSDVSFLPNRSHLNSSTSSKTTESCKMR
jgi:hypothetical protein